MESAWTRKESFAAAGKQATLYWSREAGAPLVVVNSYSGDGESLVQAMRAIGCGDCNLLSVGGLEWNRDMAPWDCPPLSKGDRPCVGGADAYLDALLGDILPQALARVEGTPAFFALAGYSLAGLFALYATYRCDAFACVAGVSGSFWFPGFYEFAVTHATARPLERMYFSLGDHEARSSNPMLRTVQDNTEALVAHYRGLDIDVTYELNPGNHFKQPSLRSAKGVAALVLETTPEHISIW